LLESRFDRSPTDRIPVYVSNAELAAMEEVQAKKKKEDRKMGEQCWSSWVRENPKRPGTRAPTHVDCHTATNSRPLSAGGAGPSFEEWTEMKKEKGWAAPKSNPDFGPEWLEAQIQQQKKEMIERIAQTKLKASGRLARSACSRKKMMSSLTSSGLSADSLTAATASHSAPDYDWAKRAAIEKRPRGLAFMLEAMTKSPYKTNLRQKKAGEAQCSKTEHRSK
jgi:hypothetical protein